MPDVNPEDIKIIIVITFHYLFLLTKECQKTIILKAKKES